MTEFTTSQFSELRTLIAAKAAAPPDPPKPKLSSKRPNATVCGTHKAADAATSVVPAAPEPSAKVVPSVPASTPRPRKRLPRAPKGTPRDQSLIRAKAKISACINLIAKIQAGNRAIYEARRQGANSPRDFALATTEASIPSWESQLRGHLEYTLPVVRRYLDELDELRRANNTNTPKENETEHE